VRALPVGFQALVRALLVRLVCIMLALGLSLHHLTVRLLSSLFLLGLFLTSSISLVTIGAVLLDGSERRCGCRLLCRSLLRFEQLRVVVLRHHRTQGNQSI
jgi:hypothetical protein